MALANYSDLQQALTDWLARSDLTGFYGNLVALFEAGFNANPDCRFRQMEEVTSLTPDATGSVALPSDFLEARRVRWTGSPNVDLQYVHPSYFTEAYGDSPSSTPLVYTITDGSLKVMPLSTTPVSLTYWQAL